MPNEIVQPAKLAHFLREQKPYTRNELKTIFQCDESKLDRIIRQLRRLKIMKIHRKDEIDGYSDMTEIADEVTDIQDVLNDTSGYGYGFVFVGLIIVEGILLKIYPKYIRETNEPERELKQVIRVISKYSNEAVDINMFSDSQAGNSSNILAKMLYLLNDYSENGIYNNEQLIQEYNGRGEILWDRTVNSTYPILQDGYPVYTDLITRKRINDEYDYFRRLHMCILSECSKIFTKYSLFEYFDGFEELELCDEDLENFGDSDYIAYRLEREITQEFNTRKQMVLKAMLSFITSGHSLNDIESVSIYGTNSFNIIWEKVCGKVLNDKLEVRLKDLDLPCSLIVPKDLTENNILKDIMEVPKWRHRDEEQAQRAGSPLIPDIISWFKYDGKNCFVIFDGKYYCMQFEKGKAIKNQPDTPSVTKQFLYELAYRAFIEDHDFKVVKNSFVMPREGVCSENIGYVDLDMFSFVGLKKIDILMLSAEMVYSHYLEDKKIDPLLLGYLFESNKRIQWVYKGVIQEFILPESDELLKVAADGERYEVHKKS